MAELLAFDGDLDEFFGESVSRSGNVAVVGAFRSGDAGFDSGSAYVYVQSGVDCNRNGQPDACDIFLGVSCDSNANGVPDECELAPACPADINGDGLVNSEDLTLLLGAWAAGGCP